MYLWPLRHRMRFELTFPWLYSLRFHQQYGWTHFWPCRWWKVKQKGNESKRLNSNRNMLNYFDKQSAMSFRFTVVFYSGARVRASGLWGERVKLCRDERLAAQTERLFLVEFRWFKSYGIVWKHHKCLDTFQIGGDKSSLSLLLSLYFFLFLLPHPNFFLTALIFRFHFSLSSLYLPCLCSLWVPCQF